MLVSAGHVCAFCPPLCAYMCRFPCPPTDKTHASQALYFDELIRWKFHGNPPESPSRLPHTSIQCQQHARIYAGVWHWYGSKTVAGDLSLSLQCAQCKQKYTQPSVILGENRAGLKLRSQTRVTCKRDELQGMMSSSAKINQTNAEYCRDVCTSWRQGRRVDIKTSDWDMKWIMCDADY